MKGPPRETVGGLFIWRAVVELSAAIWFVAFLESQRSLRGWLDTTLEPTAAL